MPKERSGLGSSSNSSTSVLDNDGSRIDLSDSPLRYGNDDSNVQGETKRAVDEFEDKRRESKIEYNRVLDENGNVIAENRGGKSSVKTKFRDMVRATTFTHNHPREAGTLGGTFSEADLDTFGNTMLFPRMRTMRAAAKEGTYTISRDSAFNGTGFRNYYSQVVKAAQRDYNNRRYDLINSAMSGTISGDEYNRQATKAFNKFLVDLHNGLLSGQKQYGYTYSLERRRR